MKTRDILFGCLIVGLIVIGAIATNKMQSQKSECADNGGFVNEYNCVDGYCHSWQCVYR
jgi:hypothetical protein